MDIVFNDATLKYGDKVVLDNVFGAAHHGEILAIMGPTGAGKTTLLNVMAGRLPLSDGNLYVNGSRMNKITRRRVAYVLQSENFFPSLKLRDTLQYTAMLRLPEKMPRKEKQKRLDYLVNDLELTKCLNTEMMRLSGGEKKRANIACELLTNPQILVLDEPTSGLDSNISCQLIGSLKVFAEKYNKTIILTIHQPSSKVFRMFNRVLLLADGKTAYYGDRVDILDYFSRLNFHCEPGYNIADFILDMAKEGADELESIFKGADEIRNSDMWKNELENMLRSSSAIKPIPKIEEKSTADDTVENGIVPKPIENGVVPKTVENGNMPKSGQTGEFMSKPTQNDLFKGVDDLEEVKVEPKIVMGLDAEIEYHYDYEAKYLTSFWFQCGILFVRNLRQNRSRVLCLRALLQHAFVCLVACLLWFQIGMKEEALNDRIAGVYIMLTYWLLQSVVLQIHTVTANNMVVSKERASGAYHLQAYLLTKLLGDWLLFFIPCVAHVSCIYWAIGMKGVAPYFATVATVYFTLFVGSCMGLVIACIFMDTMNALSVMVCAVITTILTGGFFTRTIPFWFEWIKYLSLIKFSYDVILELEFTDGKPITCAQNSELSMFTECHKPNVTLIESDAFFQFFPIDLPIAANILAIAGYALLFYLVSVLTLRFARKPVKTD
ncbi:uncharacterized protein LOC141911935 [Tubulanus polymorphus]|uniref:uncharacterized protein LOC141911935 n=1 Tax=Tubulanus polymorphus TaxID=672921 RepID=UPI003DA2FA49